MSSHGHGHGHGQEEIPRVDVKERGGKGPDGEPQVMDKRLFVQLLVFDCERGVRPDDAIQKLATELRLSGDADIQAAAGILGMQASNTRSGILSTASSHLSFLRGTIVHASLSQSSIDLDDVVPVALEQQPEVTPHRLLGGRRDPVDELRDRRTGPDHLHLGVVRRPVRVAH